MTEPASPAPLDHRRNAARPDLADVRLQDRYTATTYVAGAAKQVRAPALPMKKAPVAAGGLENEVIFGDALLVFEEKDGWAWAQRGQDGYVGYVPAQGLSREVLTATHRVTAVGTFIYPEPDIKTIPLAHLTMGSHVTVSGQQDRFAALTTGGYVIARHLAEVARYAIDFVAVAERFAGTPYLWGGRTRLGLDCSGLVQIAMEAAGLPCPRDTDMQAAEVGAAVDTHNLDDLDRGDLVFWPGHVGIMTDGIMLLHANGHHMSTVYEPLSEAVARIARDAGDRGKISAIKRPSSRGRPRATEETT